MLALADLASRTRGLETEVLAYITRQRRPVPTPPRPPARGAWSEVERFAGADFATASTAPPPDWRIEAAAAVTLAGVPAGRRALAGRPAATCQAKPPQCVGSAGRGAARGRAGGRGTHGLDRIRGHPAPPRSARIGQAASPSTATSRTIRRPSRRRLKDSGARSGPPASSPGWSPDRHAGAPQYVAAGGDHGWTDLHRGGGGAALRGALFKRSGVFQCRIIRPSSC